VLRVVCLLVVANMSPNAQLGLSVPRPPTRSMRDRQFRTPARTSLPERFVVIGFPGTSTLASILNKKNSHGIVSFYPLQIMNKQKKSQLLSRVTFPLLSSIHYPYAAY